MYSDLIAPYPSTTPEYWSVDDVPLNAHAFNITTWGGAKQSPPPLRGSNVVIPGRRGQLWVPKVLDSYTLTFTMWVIGADELGRPPYDGQNEQLFRSNFRFLKKLLWSDGTEQIKLTKRFWDDHTDTAVPIEASTLVEFAGGLSPEMTGSSRADFSIDYFLSDPLFHGIQSEQKFSAGTILERRWAGDVPSNDVEIEIVGQMVNPQLEVDGLGRLIFPVTVAAGDRVVIDCANYLATYYPASGSPFTVSGKVVSTFPGVDWFTMPTGIQKLRLYGSGSGSVFFRHRTLWL